MTRFQFTNRVTDSNGIEDFLLDNVDLSLVIPGDCADQDVITYFQNGDRMEIHTKTGMITWDTIHPGNAVVSKINWIIHKWFADGTIREVT